MNRDFFSLSGGFQNFNFFPGVKFHDTKPLLCLYKLFCCGCKQTSQLENLWSFSVKGFVGVLCLFGCLFKSFSSYHFLWTLRNSNRWTLDQSFSCFFPSWSSLCLTVLFSEWFPLLYFQVIYWILYFIYHIFNCLELKHFPWMFLFKTSCSFLLTKAMPSLIRYSNYGFGIFFWFPRYLCFLKLVFPDYLVVWLSCRFSFHI